MSIHWGGRGAGHISRWSASTTGVPALEINFLSGTLDPRITFSRSTTGTFVGSNGLIQTAAINAPRFDYDPSTLAAKGLLIEETRANLITYSEEFDNVIWSKNNVSVTQNTANSPSGTLTADLVSEVAVPTSHLWTQTISYTSGVSYTFSVYMKKGPGATAPDWMQLTFGSAAFGASQYANFNLATGAVGTVLGGTATIQNAGSGWYRLSFTATATATTTTPAALAFINNTNASARLPTYTGATTSDVLVWGAGVEAGAFPTSYIPTTTTSLTRNADVVSMTGTNFSDWYNASEGTLVSQSTFNGNSAAFQRYAMAVSDGSSNNRITMTIASSTQTRAIISTGGVLQADVYNTVTSTFNTPIKAAIAYKANDIAVCCNAGVVQNDTSATIPTVNAAYIGGSESGAGGVQLNGTVAKIAYYNTRLSDYQLQILTQ
jgi:hypothetical protein